MSVVGVITAELAFRPTTALYGGTRDARGASPVISWPTAGSLGDASHNPLSGEFDVSARSPAEAMDHSYRSAAIGSALDALRAGRYPAMIVNSSTSPTAVHSENGSALRNPKSSLAIQR